MKRLFQHWIWVGLIILTGSSLAQQPPAKLQQEVRRLTYQVQLMENYIQLIQNPTIARQFKERLRIIRQEINIARQFIQQRKFRIAVEHLRNARTFLVQLEQIIIQRTRFQVQLRKGLDAAIRRAEKAVQQTQHHAARQLLEQAKVYRHRAIVAYRQQAIFQAIEYYRLAEYFAQNAIDLATRGDENVRQLFQRTWVLFNDLQNASVATSREFRQKLNVLRTQLKTIRQLLDEGRTQEARKLLRRVIFELYRYLVAQKPGTLDASEVMARWQAVQNNLRQIERRQGTNPAVWNQLLQQAQRLSRQVQEALNRKEYRVAMKKMNLLVRLLYRMESMSTQQNGLKTAGDPRQVLEQELQDTRRLVEELRQTSETNASPYVQLLDQLLVQAEQLIQQSQWVQASYVLKVVNQLMVKYYQVASTRGTNNADQQLAWQYLQRLRELVQKVSAERNAAQTVRLSQEILRTAEQLYAQQQYEKAKALCEYGLRLLTR